MAEVLRPGPEADHFSSSPLRSSSPSTTALNVGSPQYTPPSKRAADLAPIEIPSVEIPSYPRPTSGTSTSISAPSSPVTSQRDLSHSSRSSSYQSTQNSSVSLKSRFDVVDDAYDEEINFPTYSNQKNDDHVPDFSPIGNIASPPTSPAEESTPSSAGTEPVPVALDDTDIKPKVETHVDYLAHEWEDEDIWASWRHVVSKRADYGEVNRLENASWRQWAKQQYNLRTISPETLNWLKDCDITFLYGPLQHPMKASSFSNHASEPSSHLSKTNSFLHKKPILKKRSMSEVMLQKSLSTSSLIKQAAASVQAQQGRRSSRSMFERPSIVRASSDFVSSPFTSTTISRDTSDQSNTSKSTSGLITPSSEKRHIRFDEKVEQCIAVECKDCDDDDDGDPWALQDEDSSSDDGVVMMKRTNSKKSLSRTNSRGSFSGENKIIAKLPDTTLKYRTDSPDLQVNGATSNHSLGFWRSSKLSPSPSQETLRPSNPSRNFLLGVDEEDEDEAEMSWAPSGAYQASGSYQDRQDSAITSAVQSERSLSKLPDEREESPVGLRRTPSGMFMPYEEDEDDIVANGLFGRAIDTLNTARDIAHVIWNVGWRR